ncbi:MAG: hypothetical protein IAI50_06415 [Candidatus Eremiobacteraeota bacterium]|nr:hypothetical protein [Candidatus Eremiobacteraeota bacterium]
MLSWTRIATLVGCFAVAAIAAFGAVDRGRAGGPLAKLVPDGPTSNTRYLVKHAPAGSRLRSGDRVELDDPRELAAR